MKPQTLDQAIIEASRFLQAAKKLRKVIGPNLKQCRSCYLPNHESNSVCKGCKLSVFGPAFSMSPPRESAAVKRASLDLTHKLADLRLGR